MAYRLRRRSCRPSVRTSYLNFGRQVIHLILAVGILASCFFQDIRTFATAVSNGQGDTQNLPDTILDQVDGRSMSLESGRYMETVGKFVKRTCTSVSDDSFPYRLDVYVVTKPNYA